MQHTIKDKPCLAGIISDRLSKSPEVRPFPTAVTQLSAACQNSISNSQTFASIIERDPALSAKILRMANSPIFCPAGQVKGIAHAATVLGVRKLRSVAMSVAGAEMFSSGEQAQNQRLQLWNHSIGCAVVARSVAGHFAGVDKDEAFLAGVFHDIGKLFFYDAIPNEYSETEASFSGSNLVKEEELRFGTTHEVIGLASAESWELPLEIRTAIGWHHRPSLAESCPAFAQVIHVADRLAKHWGIGSDGSPEENLLDGLEREFGLIKSQFDSMEEEARRVFDETQSAAG